MCWDQVGLATSIWELLLRAMREMAVAPPDNVVMWWDAILVRSALLGQEEGANYISQGQFNMNMLPMDLGERLDAIIHCSKVFFLYVLGH